MTKRITRNASCLRKVTLRSEHCSYAYIAEQHNKITLHPRRLSLQMNTKVARFMLWNHRIILVV
jgi:hypothetical protein